MIEDFWKDKYPAGIAAEINPDEYQNIQAVLKQSCQRFANKPAFSNLGKTVRRLCRLPATAYRLAAR